MVASQKPPKQRVEQHCAPVVHAAPVVLQVRGGAQTLFAQLPLQQSAPVAQPLPSGAHGVVHAPFTQSPLQQSVLVAQAPPMGRHCGAGG